MRSYLSLLRLRQWSKNLLLFFPPFFGGSFFAQDFVGKVLPAYLAFCTAASSHYIINDLRDKAADRCHPLKRLRPLASGSISTQGAIFLSMGLLTIAVTLSTLISFEFFIYLLVYLLVSLSYTFYFKSVVIMDIFIISAGFLLRVLAGGEAFGVEVSNWLFMTVFLVSLFLAVGKRMGEQISMGDQALNHRKSLGLYSASFLEGALWFAGSAALVTYSLYTVERQTNLFYSVPIAAYGLIRYVYLAGRGKGDPTDVLLHDHQTMAVGILWALFIAGVVYGKEFF